MTDNEQMDLPSIHDRESLYHFVVSNLTTDRVLPDPLMRLEQLARADPHEYTKARARELREQRIGDED